MRRYRQQDVATPYEKFKSLPRAERFLRPGVTFEILDHSPRPPATSTLVGDSPIRALSMLEGRDTAETARLMGLSRSVVRPLLARAVSRMRRIEPIQQLVIDRKGYREPQAAARWA